MSKVSVAQWPDRLGLNRSVSSDKTIKIYPSWQGDRFTDEGNSLFPHYITRLSDLNGSPFALGDYSKAWGSNAEVLNMTSGEWTARESYPYSDWITHYATVSMLDEIIIFGGWDGTLRPGFKVFPESDVPTHKNQYSRFINSI